MKHRAWYMIYGKPNRVVAGNKCLVYSEYALTNIASIIPKNREENIRTCPICISLRLYSLCPNLRYKPRGLPAFWESSFVLTFTILVLFVKMPIIGVNKYKYARKDHRANAEFSPSTYGLIIYEIKTTSNREKIILSLLAVQKLFLGVTAFCILYRPLGGFLTPSVLCVVDAILYPPITSILSTTPFTSEFNTKKKKVQ